MSETPPGVSLDDFFAGHDQARAIFNTVRRAVDALGPADMRVSKSQVSFRRRRPFAAVWIPEQYLKRKVAPLVLTVYFRRRDRSPRWKQVVEPARGRFTHHLELYAAEEVDDDVRAWLREGWEDAG